MGITSLVIGVTYMSSPGLSRFLKLSRTRGTCYIVLGYGNEFAGSVIPPNFCLHSDVAGANPRGAPAAPGVLCRQAPAARPLPRADETARAPRRAEGQTQGPG